ncbi:TIGR02285 family protein [Desulfococcaceae bacterium HSG8]|nr:TIGR02285 family protein [Desulfococcaceae bacterium HSG8]
MFRCTCSLTAVLLLTLLFPAFLFAGDTITWVIVDYPPVYIIEGEKKGEGILDNITELVTEKLPEYEHSISVANIRRTMADFEKGEKVCTIGMIKTEERKKIAHYSTLPSTFLTPNSLMIRKEDRERFGNTEVVSLEKLLRDKSLKLGLASKISHGKGLDPIIEKYKHQENIFFRKGNDIVTGLIRMLLKKRIDYMICLPWVATYLLEPEEREKVLFISAQESHRETIVYYSLCSKTDWGRQVIEKVDAILQKERPTERYRSCIEKWMPKKDSENFRKAYDTEFLKINSQQ